MVRISRPLMQVIPIPVTGAPPIPKMRQTWRLTCHPPMHRHPTWTRAMPRSRIFRILEGTASWSLARVTFPTRERMRDTTLWDWNRGRTWMSAYRSVGTGRAVPMAAGINAAPVPMASNVSRESASSSPTVGMPSAMTARTVTRVRVTVLVPVVRRASSASAGSLLATSAHVGTTVAVASAARARIITSA